jgi:hypothetical protein
MLVNAKKVLDKQVSMYYNNIKNNSYSNILRRYKAADSIRRDGKSQKRLIKAAEI